MKILLAVDVQNDFCPGGLLGVQDGDKVVPIINKLITEGDYDLVIASQDWHPANHCSFGEWPIHCVEETFGAALRADLLTSKIHKIIKKGTNQDIDSYSAFYDNAKLQSTGLPEYLEQEALLRGESLEECEIHVVGLALDYCVKFSALDAAKLGLITTVIYDATKAVNLDPGDLAEGRLSDEQKTLQQLTEAGVNIITSSELAISNGHRRNNNIPLEQSLVGERNKEIQRGM